MPNPPDRPATGPSAPAPRMPRWLRFLPLALVLVAMIVVFASGLYRQISLEALIRHRATIDSMVTSNFAAAVAAYIGIYIAAAALSIPGGGILTISGGLLFGTAVGTAAAIVGATIGATILFLITRSAVGDWLLLRTGARAARIAADFREDAFNYLLFLRLIPVFPFWLVNLMAGVGGVALRPFVTATVIGIIPTTAIFAFFGAGLDGALAGQAKAYEKCLAQGLPGCRLDFDFSAAATPQLLAALAALCLVALAPVIGKRFRATRRAQNSPP